MCFSFFVHPETDIVSFIFCSDCPDMSNCDLECEEGYKENREGCEICKCFGGNEGREKHCFILIEKKTYTHLKTKIRGIWKC